MPSPVYSSRISRAIVLREPITLGVAVGAYNTFEGGSNGTGITTANSGGFSGAPFDQITFGAGGTAVFDSANAIHGGLCAKLLGGSTTGIGYTSLRWQSATLGTLNDGYGRVYYKAASLANSPNPVQGLLSGATKWTVLIDTTGHIKIQDAGALHTITSTSTVTAGSWFRLDFHHSTATEFVCRIFLTPDSATPDETLTMTGGTMANIDQIMFGSAAGDTAYVDDIAAGLASWPGPSVSVSSIAPPNGAQVI